MSHPDVLLGPYPEVDELIDKAIGPQGPAGGVWSSSKPYTAGDVVSRTKAGILYVWIAVQATAGDDPALDDGTNWTQGDQIDVVSIQFDVSESVADPSIEGLLSWNANDKAPQYGSGISGVSNQLGQEMWTPRSKNDSGVQINNGQAVYISGASGSNPTIALARADDPSTHKVIALATHDIANNDFGYCTAFGMVRDIDTSAFGVGDELFLSATTAGALTATAPTSPDLAIRVGIVIVSNANNGSIFVTVVPEHSQFLKALKGILTSHRETIKIQTNVSGNIAIDCDDGNVQEITLNGNMTDQTFSNVPASGTSFTLAIKLIQDVIGTRTAAWNAAIDWGDDGAPTISTTANYWDWIFLTTTDGGTSWEGTYRIGYGA